MTRAEESALANPFKNILRLSVGDFIAKALTFLAFVWLARMLGVQNFGVLEFANSMLAWFLLLADGGLELWATRETARTQDVPALVARVVPLRFLLATASFVLLFLLLPVMPENGNLRIVLALFGLSLFAQAASLKWLFLGREQMARVGAVLVASQLAFAVGVFALIRKPEHVLWVPLVKFAADSGLAIGFAHLYRKEHGSLLLRYTFSGARIALGPAIIMGMTQAMGLLNFNFDTILIGLLLGIQQVGYYNAAYKPVITLLAIPLTYFTGLFPALARAWNEGPESLRPLAQRSLHLCAAIAIPCGIGGTLLAGPAIHFLFGRDYGAAATPFSILVWSAVLVILRGTYRHSLNAAGLPKLDLRCAVASSAVNVSLNLLLIPRWGLTGAAVATVAADVVWLALAVRYCNRHVVRLSLLAAAWRPLAAALFLLLGVISVEGQWWITRAAVGAAAYAVAFLGLGFVANRWVERVSLPAKRVTKLLAVIALLAATVWAAWWEPAQLVVKQVEIRVAPELAFPESLRVAVISDLHAGSWHIDLNKVKAVVSAIEAQRPDLIVFLGDFVAGDHFWSDPLAPEVVAQELGRLRSPLGVYAVLGNVDHLMDGPRIQSALTKSGVTVLTNDAVSLEHQSTMLWLAGLDDLWRGKPDPDRMMRSVKPGEPVILLTHNPDIFMAHRLPTGVHLALAGHTHGGQVNLPLFGRLVWVHSDYGQRYAAGHVVEEGNHLFVTTGIGTSVVPVRFRVPPEVVILTIRGR